MARLLSRHWLGLAVAGLLLASLLLSLAHAPPHPLPAVALGSTALLYAEKAAAFFAVLLTAAVVLVRAFAGDLPSEIRGLRYEMRRAEEDAASNFEALASAQQQLARRQRQIRAVDEPEDER